MGLGDEPSPAQPSRSRNKPRSSSVRPFVCWRGLAMWNVSVSTEYIFNGCSLLYLFMRAAPESCHRNSLSSSVQLFPYRQCGLMGIARHRITALNRFTRGLQKLWAIRRWGYGRWTEIKNYIDTYNIRVVLVGGGGARVWRIRLWRNKSTSSSWSSFVKVVPFSFFFVCLCLHRAVVVDCAFPREFHLLLPASVSWATNHPPTATRTRSATEIVSQIKIIIPAHSLPEWIVVWFAFASLASL